MDSRPLSSLFLLIILVLIGNGEGSHHNGVSFPESLYPTPRMKFREECPYLANKFDYCVSRYGDCFGQMKSVKDCNLEFCDCIEILGGPESCHNYSANACFSVHQQGGFYQKSIARNKTKRVVDIIQKRLEPIHKLFSKLLENCDAVNEMALEKTAVKKSINTTDPLLDTLLSFFLIFKLEPKIHKSGICQKVFAELEKTMEDVDVRTASSLMIPYDFWLVGWEFGPLGRVIMRVVSEEVCEKASMDLNHNTAFLVNCYDRQYPKKQCDEEYFERNLKTLSTMDSKKLNCKLMIDSINTIRALRSEELYQKAADYHIESSLTAINGKFSRSFSGLLNGSLTMRDTRRVVIKLEATEKLPLRVLDYFDRVSAECGDSREIVTSCGFSYEHCNYFVKNDCDLLLSTCINEMDHMNSSCRESVDELTEILWPNNIGKLSIQKMVLSEEERNISDVEIIFIATSVIIGMCIAAFMVAYSWQKFTRKGSSATSSTNSEVDVPLIALDQSQNKPNNSNAVSTD